MKLEASEVFNGKKACYADSVAKPFMSSRLGEYMQNFAELLWNLSMHI